MVGNEPTANRRAGVAGRGRDFLGRSVRGMARRIARRPGLLWSSYNVQQDKAAAERNVTDRRKCSGPPGRDARRFFDKRLPSFIHTCRATPRRQLYTTTQVASHICIASIEWTESNEHRRYGYPSSKQATQGGGWPAKDGTPKPFRNEEHGTPGRSARRRSCSCVSLGGRRTVLSESIPLLVLVRCMF
jgi:hypothetical protein